MSQHSERLHRIAAANEGVEVGHGISEDHLVPACTIYNRLVAARYKQSLIDADISYQEQRDRLCTRFSVAKNRLSTALQVRDKLLEEQPDIMPRRFSRDYDSFFLLSPFLLLAMLVSLLSRSKPYMWLGVAISGVSFMIVLELANRRYRAIQASQFRISDLVWMITLVAINLAIWRVILAL